MKTEFNVTRLFAPMAIGFALIALPLVPTGIAVSSAGASGTSSIQGTVIDASNSSDLAGVCVTAYLQGGDPAGTTGMTALDGTYSITGLAPGPYLVFFDPTCSNSVSSQEIPQWYSNSLTEVGATQVTLTSDFTMSSVDASLQLFGSISGTVTDAYNLGGLDDVCVSAVSSDGGSGSGSAITAFDGTYTITGLVPDTYTVNFDPTCTGLHSTLDIAAPYETPVNVAAGNETQSIDAALATIPPTSTGVEVTSNANPGFAGASITYDATVTPTDNGGTVAFSDNGQLISACEYQPLTVTVASCTLTYLGVGLHQITAAYTGDETYASSASTNYDETIQIYSPPPSPPSSPPATPPSSSSPSKTSTELTSNANPATSGKVTYIAVVSPTDNNGTVNFSDGSQPIAGCQDVALTSGTATCQVIDPSSGSHTISASFSGTSDYGSSTSSNLVERVRPKTATTLISSYNPAGDQAAISFTATTSPKPAGGTMRFEMNGAAISGCAKKSLTDGASTCEVKDLSPGDYVIKAVYLGDSGFESSTSRAYLEKVLQNREITIRSSAGVAKEGKTILFVARVKVKYGSGFLNFTDNGRTIRGCNKVELQAGVGICSVGNLSVGKHVVSVAFSGNARFGPSYNGLLEVIK